MINTTERRNINSTGQVLETANYHIDQEAVPHITAMLRNMYSDPIQAIMREYIANAVDAHNEAHKIDQPIRIHLPSRMNSWFSVRDVGGGLDLAKTRKLLYGYGASGDLKRTSNEQIGGFGIGCKSAFAVSDTFTYTIWHGGRQRVWTCFLDDRDVGQALLASDEPSAEAAGIEVKIPIPNSSIDQVQRALNVILPFMPGKFDFGETSYMIPEKPTPILAVDALCSIDQKSFPITYTFYGPQALSEVNCPAIVVGNAIYGIDEAQLKDFVMVEDAYSDKGRRMRQLLQHLIIHVPIGFLQLAPSREHLQYSALTRKVLKHLLTDFSGAALQTMLSRNATTQLAGCSLLEKRRRLELLGLEPTDRHSRREGLVVPADAVSACWNVSMNNFQYNSGRLYNTTSYPESTWESLGNLVFLPSDWFSVDVRDYTMLVDAGDKCSEEQAKVLAKCAISKVRDEGVTEAAGAYRFHVIVVTKLQADSIDWLVDGSIKVLKREELPTDYNDAYFSYQTQRAAATHVRNPGISLGTKFVQLRATERARHEGDGRWWDKVKVADLKKRTTRMVYVELDRYLVVTPRTTISMTSGVKPTVTTGNFMSPVRFQEMISSWPCELFPEMSALFGIRRGDKKIKEVRNSSQYISLWEYLAERFTYYASQKLIDPEKLLRQVAMTDLDWNSVRSPNFSVLKSLVKSPELSVCNSAVALKTWCTEYEKFKGVNADWLKVITSLREHGLKAQGVYEENAGFFRGDTLQLYVTPDLKMFDFPDTAGPMAAWWDARPRGTWADLAGITGRRTSSPLETMLKEFCCDFPLIAAACQLTNLWPARDSKTLNTLTVEEKLQYTGGEIPEDTLQQMLLRDSGIRQLLASRVGVQPAVAQTTQGKTE